MNGNDSYTGKSAAGENATAIWTVSWVAYVPSVVTTCAIFIAIYFSRYFFDFDNISAAITVLVSTIVLGFTVYEAYYLSCIRLFIDDTGVWVYRGVFPWSRGVYGVKWRDFEDALFTTNIFYWIAKGYPITLRPRFSNNPHIHVPAIHRGRLAVELINKTASQYARPSNPLV